MKLNDTYLKQLINDYQHSESADALDEFQKVVLLYAKNWPKQQYFCNEDICSDFMVYILDHMKQIMKSFPLGSQVAFQTWFNGVLYNKFCDFSKQGTVSSQDLVLGGDWYENYGVAMASSIEEYGKTSLEWRELVNHLSLIDKSLWLFYYVPQDISPECLEEIARYTKKSLQTILIYYQEILEVYYETYVQKELYRQKLVQIDSKIAHLENMLKRCLREKEDILTQKILRLKNRQYKHIRYLKRTTNDSFKIFIKLFTGYDTAYRILKKINKNMRKILVRAKE